MHIKAVSGLFISTALWNSGVRPGGGHIAPEAPGRKTEVGNGAKLTLELAVNGFGNFDIQMATFLLPFIGMLKPVKPQIFDLAQHPLVTSSEP